MSWFAENFTPMGIVYVIVLAVIGAALFDVRGWGAEQAENLHESCAAGSDVVVTVLLHTERVLDVACK